MSDFLAEIERSVPSLRRYARALLRDRDLADDLVQDCLERALSRRHLWRPNGTTRGWLFTILHNLYANDMRRRAARPGPLPIEAVEAGLGYPAEQADRLAARDTIQALMLLPVEQRQVILLVALEGLSYKEVAELLDIPIGTVMSRLSRGRERLRSLTDGSGTPDLRRVK